MSGYTRAPGASAPISPEHREEKLRSADRGHRHDKWHTQGLNSGLPSTAQGSEGNRQRLRHRVFTLSTYVINGMVPNASREPRSWVVKEGFLEEVGWSCQTWEDAGTLGRGG